MYSYTLCLTLTLDGVGGQRHASPALLPSPSPHDPLAVVWEAGWAPGPVWKGAENLAPTEIRPPVRTTRS